MNVLKKLQLPLIIVTVLATAIAYYYYSIRGLPEKIAQSTGTVMNVDSIRFTFKVSLMAEKGYSSYLEALRLQSEDELDNAINYFEASIGFLKTRYTIDQKFVDDVQPELEKAISLIQTYRLNMPHSQIIELNELVTDIYLDSENREREAWHKTRENYIEFRTQEYKSFRLYQVIAIVFLLLLSLSFWLYWRQRKLLKLNKLHEAELLSLAFYDPLTGIPNRKNIESLLEKQLVRAQRHHSSFFIALIDLDDFKNVNDLLGHEAGDQLLIEYTKRLTGVIREEDIMGRLGGDEFLLVFDEFTQHEELNRILERITRAFSLPIQINYTEFYVTFSMGIAQYPKDAQGKSAIQSLVKSADIAMYHAKQQGKNQFSFYDEQLGEMIQLEHEMDIEIKRALENDEFELYYQPQIDANTLEVIGAEALVRWNHPTRNLIMPNEFIDYIEKGYHTTAFGEWVINQAVQQQKTWQQQGLNIKVAINLSVKHIASPDFRENLTRLIRQLDADLSHLVFEITEYELIAYQSTPIEDLKKLADAGFVFHLDDFGTGYSSISYLSQLPIQSIKIDKSFIDYIQADNQQKRMVEAIIHIAEALNIKIIAEGVETEYQVNYLQQQHCHAFQGYFFSRPLTVEAFNDYLNARKQNRIA
ncbi:putative bifunctional diguanylate cyclase/phosphodiesterase [Thiomicrorhabdus sp.]|uniref:putative bifunctional diguanylate cyclase/phosphodiesterase n=1 Tax=Thiomicrorhabdus sp. TaxID=2039724 RepID=UPI003567D2F0